MIPGVDSVWPCSRFGVVALSLDSLWSSWPWIPFGLALDDSGVNGCGGGVVAPSLDSVWSSWAWISPAVNGCGGGSLVCRKNHQQNERTTRQRKSNDQTIVCMGLAIACSFRGFCLESVAVAPSLDSLWSSWSLFGGRSGLYDPGGAWYAPPGV